ncbi:ComEA family DNA-binding protein [Arthrobacter sp. H20]|uniref:ComEA family DNA-binding protein n=1 Tax=Arthrobacter sp. H20 TaxID=1267981 RepID=UPI0020A65F01|nr:ComEA family DNA-binding protein [Arthrobacter sp. H20]
MARHRWPTSPPHRGISAPRTQPLDHFEGINGFRDREDSGAVGTQDSDNSGGRRWAVGRGAALLVLGLTLTIAAGLVMARSGPSPEITSVALDARAETQQAGEVGSGLGGPPESGAPPPDERGDSVSDAGSSADPAAAVPGEPPTGDASSQRLLVHVAGAVASPGIVELAAGARVFEALDHAGGALPEADLAAINLAAPVQDGLQVRVPLQGETMAPAPAAGAAGGTGGSGGSPAPADGTTPSGTVNINTAALAELETLPRIGPVLAERIVQWRTEHGGFTRPEDLDAVPGIGETMLAALVPLVTV